MYVGVAMSEQHFGQWCTGRPSTPRRILNQLD